MRENQTLIEDMVTLGGNILGNLMGTRHEFKAQAKQRMDSIVRQLDLVGRNEFDAAFAMLAKARTMQEELQERLAAIEAHLNLPVYAAAQLRRPGHKHAEARLGEGVSSAKKVKTKTKLNLPSVKKGNRRKKRA